MNQKQLLEKNNAQKKQHTVGGWRRDLPYLIAIFCLLLAWGLSFVVIKEKKVVDEAKKQERVERKQLANVILLEVHPQGVDDMINLPGTVEAWTSLNLLAKVNGAISEMLVREGDTVLEGQLLARIEADDYRIALDAADATYRLALTEYERSKTMIKTKVISPAAMEAAQTSLLTAKAALARAKLELSRTEIVAPISGTVDRIYSKKGAYLGVGDPVALLLVLDPVKAVVGIPESDVDAVRDIETVDVTIQALQGRRVAGKTSFLSSSPESNAFLYRLELALTNPDHQILPGMFVRAHIVKRHIKDAFMIPLYSILTRGDDQFVYVAKNSMVERRPVETGVIDGWLVQVVAGLQAGERILIEGQHTVENGQEINVVKIVTDPNRSAQ